MTLLLDREAELGGSNRPVSRRDFRGPLVAFPAQSCGQQDRDQQSPNVPAKVRQERRRGTHFSTVTLRMHSLSLTAVSPIRPVYLTPPALCKVFEMAEGMKANFTAAGLPYAFTEKGLTGNTFNAHRLLTYAASHSLATQDKVAESLFRAYFAEEQFPNDPQVLLAAALEGGLEESGARSLIEDENAMAEETRGELLVAQR